MNGRRPSRAFWLAVMWTGLAAMLRLIDVNGRSMWFDEGITLERLAGSWGDNLRNIVYHHGRFTIDSQPPLYFVLLKGWAELAGDGEFVLRLLSVAFSFLFVPLVYVLARRLFSARTAMFAVVFAALAPGIQWYSREMRPYAMVVCFAPAMTYLLFRGMTSAKFLLAWFAVAALSLLTHYQFTGLIAAQALIALAFVVRGFASRRWRSRREVAAVVGLIALCTVGVAVLIDAPQLLNRLTSGQEAFAFVPLNTMAESLLSGAVFGMNLVDPTAGAITWSVGIVCVAGLVLTFARRELRAWRGAAGLVAVSVAAPVLFWFGVSFVKANYHGLRHLILVVPLIFVMFAWTLDATMRIWRGRIARVAAGLAAGVLVCAQLAGLAMTFVRTPDWQDDLRSLAGHIRNHWRPGDIIVVNGGVPILSLAMYAQPLPSPIVSLTTLSDVGEDVARRLVERPSSRVWLVNFGAQPQGKNEADWLFANSQLLGRYDFGGRTIGVQLLLLQGKPPVVDELPPDVIPVGAGSSDKTTIAGVKLSPGDRFADRPNSRLSVFWRRGSEDAATLAKGKLSFRLLSGVEQWWDLLLPADLAFAPAAWKPGAIYQVDYDVPMPLGLPVQPYELQLIAREGDKQESHQTVTAPLSEEAVACCVRFARWPDDRPPASLAQSARNVLGADAVAAAANGQLEVEGSPPNLGPDQSAWPDSLDEVRRTNVEYQRVVRPGEYVPVVVTWAKSRDDVATWQTQLRLEGLLGEGVATSDNETGAGAFPISAWPIREPVRQQYAVRAPSSAQPGLYRLIMTRSRDGHTLDTALLGLVAIEDFPPAPAVNPDKVEHPVNAQVGEMSLLGYAVNGTIARGNTYDFHTFWRVNETPRGDGVLFLHVIGPDGKLVSQDDNPPEQGRRSTQTFRSGDGIDQIHRITIPPNLTSGEYQLFAGVYHRSDVTRWPAQQDGHSAKDNLVHLGAFTLPNYNLHLPLVMRDSE